MNREFESPLLQQRGSANRCDRGRVNSRAIAEQRGGASRDKTRLTSGLAGFATHFLMFLFSPLGRGIFA